MSSVLKIGMVAPSKAGKTSLMTAIFHDMASKLAGNPRGIQYWAANPATKARIQRALAEFKTVTSSDDIFEVPRMKGTQDSGHYQFAISVPAEKGTQRIGLDILDYPGGYLGTPEFQNILPHLDESVALLVPVSADILMTWKATDKVNNQLAIRKNIAARLMLDIDETVKAVKDWAKRRAGKSQPSILVFVPVKCEAYFNDNGGRKDESDALHEAVRELYVEALGLADEGRRYIQIDTHAVDADGIVEVRDIGLAEEDGVEYLVSTFRKRLNCGNDLSVKGALDVLAAILSFYLNGVASKLGIQRSELERQLEDRNVFKNLWYKIFGNDPVKKAILDTVRDNEVAFQAIAEITKLKTLGEARTRMYNQLEW